MSRSVQTKYGPGAKFYFIGLDEWQHTEVKRLVEGRIKQLEQIDYGDVELNAQIANRLTLSKKLLEDLSKP